MTPSQSRVLVEQLRLIYASMTASVLPMFPAVLLLVWTLGTPSNRDGLLAWAVFVSMTNLYSLFDARRCLARELSEQQATLLKRRLIISVGQDAERANLAKSRFLAAASHDLRQPIHTQGLFLDVLARTPLNAQ